MVSHFLHRGGESGKGHWEQRIVQLAIRQAYRVSEMRVQARVDGMHVQRVCCVIVAALNAPRGAFRQAA